LVLEESPPDVDCWYALVSAVVEFADVADVQFLVPEFEWCDECEFL
jgi:hypothetical protein